MAAPRLTHDQLVETIELYRTHGSSAKAAAAIGMSEPTFVNRLKRARAELGSSYDQAPPPATGLSAQLGDEIGQITSLSGRICTLEQALEAGQVDSAVWTVDRYVINKWEMGAKLEDGTVAVEPLWQIKVWLKRRPKADAELVGKVLLEQLAALPKSGSGNFPKIARYCQKTGAGLAQWQCTRL